MDFTLEQTCEVEADYWIPRIFDALNPLEFTLDGSSSGPAASYIHTSGEQDWTKVRLRSATTTSATDGIACREENCAILPLYHDFTSVPHLVGLPYAETAPGPWSCGNYSGSSYEEYALSALTEQQNPFSWPTLAGEKTVSDSVPFRLDDGTSTLTADSGSLISFYGIPKGTKEKAATGYYEDEGFGLMDITESRDDIPESTATGYDQGLDQLVQSHATLEANVFHQNWYSKSDSADGSTPSEETKSTTRAPSYPTISPDSEMHVDMDISHLTLFEPIQLNEEFEELEADFLHEEDLSLEMHMNQEQSWPSDCCSSVGVTPVPSGTRPSELEVKTPSTTSNYELIGHENVSPIATELELSSSDTSLQLCDLMKSAESEFQLHLYGDLPSDHSMELGQTYTVTADSEVSSAGDDSLGTLNNVGEKMSIHDYDLRNGDHRSSTLHDHGEPNMVSDNSLVQVTPMITEVSPEKLSMVLTAPGSEQVSESRDIMVSPHNREEMMTMIRIPSRSSSSASSTSSNTGIHCNWQAFESGDHPEFEIDWLYEKDIIIWRIFGKRTARTAPVNVDEELQRIVEEYQSCGQNDGRTLRSFQRRITLILNEYCRQRKRRVRYLPDFCKKALSEWVETDAHQLNPYPEKDEIRRLGEELGLTSTQVEQWFENYRVRTWNPQQNGMRKGKFFRYPTERTAILKGWILDHKHGPNPKGKDLAALTEKTGMTGGQVKQWCYNFRRRHTSEML